MKKFEIFVKLFVVLLVIFCFESYFKGEIIQKTSMDINEYRKKKLIMKQV